MGRRGMIAGLLGFCGLSVTAQAEQPSFAVLCPHTKRQGGSVYLVMTTHGTGPDEDFGKSWLGVEWCEACGAIMLPEEWRKRKNR